MVASRAGLCLTALILGEYGPGVSSAAEKSPFRAGVAVQVITPSEPMWMAGYSSRKKPAEGEAHDLYVKAVAFAHPQSGTLVLLTSDLVGISRELAESVTREVERRTGLARERIMLACSHTHCGPVTRGSLIDM